MSFPTSPTDGQLYKNYVYNATESMWQQVNPAKYFAVGFIYTQYPGMDSPSDLGWYGTWTNVSSTFAGDFFRAEGGNASTFGGGEQSDAIRNITGRFNGGLGDHGRDSGAFDTFNFTSGAAGNDWNRRDYDFDASRVVPTANENRPVNQTIRIWKRTA